MAFLAGFPRRRAGLLRDHRVPGLRTGDPAEELAATRHHARGIRRGGGLVGRPVDACDRALRADCGIPTLDVQRTRWTARPCLVQRRLAKRPHPAEWQLHLLLLLLRPIDRMARAGGRFPARSVVPGARRPVRPRPMRRIAARLPDDLPPSPQSGAGRDVHGVLPIGLLARDGRGRRTDAPAAHPTPPALGDRRRPGDRRRTPARRLQSPDEYRRGRLRRVTIPPTR